MRYNVLWIDDEYKTQDDFIGFAEQYNIDIVAYESHEEGIEDLKSRLDYFHAVILDAKVKKMKTDVVTGPAGLSASRDVIIEINSSYFLPYFIFTGQPAYQEDQMFIDVFGKFYVKGKDTEQLLKDLIDKCAESPEMQARKSYPQIFKAFDKGIISTKYMGTLLHIINCLENHDYKKVNLNAERDLLEAIFISLNENIPCIPNDCFDPKKSNKPNLEWSVQFLEERSVKTSNSVVRINVGVDKPIKAAFRKIKETTSELSHLNEDATAKHEFISTAHLLFEILEWLPEFVETNYKNYI